MTFKALKFALAFSYFAGFKERVMVKKTAGTLKRNARKKVVKKKGRAVALWSYADLTVKSPQYEPTGEVHGPLEKGGLTRTPVIVGPQIRLYQRTNKVVVVDPYDSHRWKRSDRGTKTKI